MFSGKKFTVILAGEISPRNLVYTSVMLGLQLGKYQPDMVGRDQIIQARKHLGITTQNLPVLNGLDDAKMRQICEGLKNEKGLFVADVTDAAITCKTYKEYARKLAETPSAQIRYLGIAIFGDAEVIKKHTQELKLYEKFKAKDSEPKISEATLLGTENLPAFKMILANNIPAGKLANAATILGVSFGKMYGNEIFGPNIEGKDGHIHQGLPMVNISILSGLGEKHTTMRNLRESLHNYDLPVVDVTDATKSTKSYEDYLKVTESALVSDTNYWGIGMAGSLELVNDITKNLNPYLTSGEEQTLKNAQDTSKWAAKKKASAPVASVSSGGLYGASRLNTAEVPEAGIEMKNPANIMS